MTEGEAPRTDKSRLRFWLIGIAILVVVVLILLLLRFCQPQREPVSAAAPHGASRLVTLHLGDAVITGFSGVLTPDGGQDSPQGRAAADLTFIDLDGPSARVFDPSHPGFVWDGGHWAAPVRRTFPARDIGQVFGVAIDDRIYPNVYLTATSAYGLSLVVQPDPHEPPERRTRGTQGVFWMPGQFGPGGGPGSVWRIDGRTGRTSLLADIRHEGAQTGPAGLGAIAYDSRHHQLFVSDLSTGIVHRLDLAGTELEIFDHGVDGRRAGGLSAIAHDARAIPAISSDRFDSEDPRTWGFAPPERRIWGLAVHRERLYYALAAPAQIWSIGILRDDPDTRENEAGRFAGDPRWELDLPADNGFEIADITFPQDGRMIVAQRPPVSGAYDFADLTVSAGARVYRYWLESPNSPATPGRWILQPEEFAVGYPGDHRNAAGGVDLGYGYDDDGRMDFRRCDAALWTTGDNLRGFELIEHPRDGSYFSPDGPLMVHGAQISMAGPARPFNTPPQVSYFLDFDDVLQDDVRRGHAGAVRIYRRPCGSGCPAPTVTRVLQPGATVTVPGPSLPPEIITSTTTRVIPIPIPIPFPITETEICTLPDSGDDPQQCMAVAGGWVCDPSAGAWSYVAAVQDNTSIPINEIRAQSMTPGVTISNGPVIPTSPAAALTFSGASPGQSLVVEMCGYNSAAAATGEPHDCCTITVALTVPPLACPAP